MNFYIYHFYLVEGNKLLYFGLQFKALVKMQLQKNFNNTRKYSSSIYRAVTWDYIYNEHSIVYGLKESLSPYMDLDASSEVESKL